MIRKKLVATFLTATLCTSLLAGCGGGNEASNTADSSVLRVGFEGMTVPTNWTQQGGLRDLHDYPDGRAPRTNGFHRAILFA